MELRGIIWEDFVQYRKPSMFLIAPYCSFKCDKENGTQICQNWSVSKELIINYNDDELIRRYLGNPITKAIVVGGLEPLDSFDQLLAFIYMLRYEYKCFDDVVIYTGYNVYEVIDKIDQLKEFSNIIVKFGRFIPNQKEHYDPVLGVMLASDNQFAVVL